MWTIDPQVNGYNCNRAHDCYSHLQCLILLPSRVVKVLLQKIAYSPHESTKQNIVHNLVLIVKC